MNRRAFLRSSIGAAASASLLPCGIGAEPPPLAREIGITTGSFVRHLTVEAQDGKLRLLDLPKIMREELDMRVIDLMTATLASMEPDYLDRLRTAAERAGCILSNLKMNQKGPDIGAADPALRRRSLEEYKKTIDAAIRLGCRWVRPLPGPNRPDLKIVAASFRELIDYGASRGISVLIENYGWMKDDPEAIPSVIKEVGPALRAQPDTGNWTDAARYDGLAKAFPFAVSCDFKALALDADGAHKAYDLRRCFQIAWDAGFRGPWCIEHFHNDYRQLLREMALLRDRLREWMRTARNPLPFPK
ncbi:MAG: TIM barrel protein [Chthoniobacteraceae bacterium]